MVSSRTTVGYLLDHNVIEFAFLLLILLFWSFLYFGGANQALTTGASAIYEDLLNSAFVLAGFGIAATVLTTKEKAGLFIRPTIVLLLAGFLMFGNLVVLSYYSINYTTASPSTRAYFDFFLGTGAIGSFLFFEGLGLLGSLNRRGLSASW